MSKTKIFSLFLYSLIVLSCQSKRITTDAGKYHFILTEYIDSTRHRLIPVAIYQPINLKVGDVTPIIFSHGYGANKGDDYGVDYTYLLEALAEKGYFIISIQHELKTDELLAMDEPLKITRMPNWKRGSENISFVLNKMKEEYSSVNFGKLVLIGHSNGGDMSVLFAHQHPELIHKLISLDNRRMDLPRTSKPKVYTLRSSDYPADEGVLPSDEEQKKFGITVQYTDIKHSNMDNDANEEERKYLTSKILEYLNEK